MAIDTDVLIIGAGPIGLLKAYGLKKLNPRLKIVVLEKYPEYQRHHVLNLNPEHLENWMRATHTENDPTLVALLQQLQEDNHILTTDLQKTITKLATDCGVEIQTAQEVTPEKFPSLLADSYPNVKLIVGADGTHSVTSQTLFAPDNQVKYEFDYVLQMRYEIQGQEKAPKVENQFFYHHILRKGLVANEYVGHFVDGKTPVTMQMMISHEDYLQLKAATSKNPLRPFSNNPSAVQLPEKLNSFLTLYLQKRLSFITKQYATDPSSIRISVNETPATHAKKVKTTRENAFVLLVGDAALGLSYFKGLNAGIEASAQFFNFMAPTIRQGFQDSAVWNHALLKYEAWFLKDFAPKKVNEVANYSFWQIRSLMRVTKSIGAMFNSSQIDFDEDFAPAIQDYFDHYSHNILQQNITNEWNPYPHRPYPPIPFAQFSYVPLTHTGKKILKLFSDYVKPYKCKEQMLQDFKQPLVGLGHLIVGLGKLLTSMYRLQGSLCLDGICSIIRGLIELVTTPLAWLVKPLFRGLATYLHGGYKTIEENTHLQALAQQGQDYLSHTQACDLQKPETIVYILAICNDLHRKFVKQQTRGQSTQIALEECTQYVCIRSNPELNVQNLRQYFSLFAAKKPTAPDDVRVEQVSEPTKSGAALS